jgi:2-polyprenyl-3-methyl-5-hydroxy-6-metoxy-1,4-benzoquinol methylase
MPPGVLLSYYQDGFGGQRHLQGQTVNATVNAWAVGRMLSGVPVSNVLDVGAGYGLLVHELARRFGWRVQGVELSEQESRYARERLGVDVRTGLLGAAGFAGESFDVVASFEVIEHVADPITFLREQAACVRPGGHVLVMTDNFESAAATRLGAAFPKWIPHTHVSHFGPESLRRAVLAAGLTPGHALSFTPWEYSVRALVYRLRGREVPPEQAYDVESAMATEMTGDYKFFRLRHLLNATWARATARPDLEGALMYLLATKPDAPTG